MNMELINKLRAFLSDTKQFIAGLSALASFVFSCGDLVAEEVHTLQLNTVTEPPLSTEFVDGFVDLVVKEALLRINIKLETVHLPAERGLRDANTGISDGEIVRVAGIQKDYPNLIQIPEKVMDMEFIAFSRKIDRLDGGWKGLSNYSVAFINGWKILEANVPRDAEITKVQTHSQLFNLLDLGRADIAIYERWGGQRLIKIFHIDGAKALQPPLAVRSMHVYLHKKHRNIVPLLDNALKAVKADGTYQKIYANTLGQYNN